MLACLLDCETTGFSRKDDRIVEIGAVICDENWTVGERLEFYVWEDGYPDFHPSAAAANGLTKAGILDSGNVHSPEQGIQMLSEFSKGCEYFIAHNKIFDGEMLHEHMMRTPGFPFNPDDMAMMARPWLCTATDFPHGDDKKCMRLAHLALDYGVAVDPADLHKALNDTLLMREMLCATGVSLQQFVDYAKVPWVYVQALVMKSKKDQAKAAGYSWGRHKYYHSEPEFPGMWVKKIKKDQMEKEAKDAPFPIKEIEYVKP